MAKYGRSYAVDHSKEAMKGLSRASFKKAEWFKNKYIPSFDEFINLFSTGFDFFATSAFIPMFDCANVETFKWMHGQPKILEAAESIGRLYNDIVDREFDQRAGRAASAIECYKEQHGASEEKAIEEIRKMITEAWKDMNEEYLKPSVNVPLRILKVFVNFAASVDVMYKYEDGYTKPEWLKDINTMLFVDPVPLKEMTDLMDVDAIAID